MKSGMKFLLGFTAVLACLWPVHPTLALFNPHKVISDDDMTNYSRMSLSGVQTFLTNQGGALSTYSTTDIDGIRRTAAEIIYNTSYRYHLNPQFMIAQIQKESSLITSSSTTLADWALGYGVCDSCSKSDPAVTQYEGFANQLDAAGNRIRNSYLAGLADHNSTVSGWGVGVTKTTLDGISITPENQATAVLYTYTPWVGYYGGDPNVGGNSSFYDIMQRFFPNRSSLQLSYPNLTLLQDIASGSVYKLENNLLRPITSQTALLTNYDSKQIIPVDSEVIDRYSQGDPISYPKFILLQGPTGGIYLIDQNNNRRAITSSQVFKALGYNPEEVIPVSQTDLDAIPEDAPITTADQYPLGAVVQNNVTGAIFYLDSKQRLHPIWSKGILDNRYKGYPIYPTSPAELDQYSQTVPVTFSDGTLLKIPGRPTIYVIDQGKKRPVLSGDVLDQLGGFSRVLTTTKTILQLYPTGNVLKLTKIKPSK